MSSTVSDLNIYKDFEVIWVDKSTGQPKDMDNVTLEIYNYEEAQSPKIVSSIQEPYIITDSFNSTITVTVVNPSDSVFITTEIPLQLNIIATQLEQLECPPNQYVVPGATTKIAIVNGMTKYALSACELAALINLDASGFVTSDKDGFLVLTSDYSGSDSFIQLENGTLNCIIGVGAELPEYGTDLQKNTVFGPEDMIRMSEGTYVMAAVPIFDPPFKVGERYYSFYRSNDPITSNPEISQEDFTILKEKNSSNLTFSFLK